MDDLISRQAALYSYQEVCNKVKCSECKATNEDGDCKLERWIKKLPSAERRGRWINGNEGNWNAVIVPKCSICGETFYEMNVNINGEYTYNYCPNCGAKMEE